VVNFEEIKFFKNSFFKKNYYDLKELKNYYCRYLQLFTSSLSPKFFVLEVTKKSLSLDEIAANIFVFYIAGNESSSSTIAYTLYELTQNTELLERAYQDIDSTLEKFDDVLSYEAIMDMKFIDLCVKETLRKYPGLPILNRECTKDYTVPDSSFTIEKGTSVIISLLGIHRDESFFPNPEKYDPDRFSDDRKDYDEDMYMPFGAGPRNCIAFRMGLLISKVGIVMLLKNYRFEALSNKELEFDYGAVALLPKPGMCKIKISSK
jgi:cytochrome P450 family 6